MRLVDLHPQFVRYEIPDDHWQWRCTHVATLLEAHGVRFDSPSGRGCILVWFVESRVPDGALPAARWTATGTGFDDLTLTPSINAIGDWHGWITAGEIITC